jgi:hypothetical protein
VLTDGEGRSTDVAVAAGRYDGRPSIRRWRRRPIRGPRRPMPTSRSGRCAWKPGARWTLPAAMGQGTRRTLYFFKGARRRSAASAVQGPVAIELRADADVPGQRRRSSEFLLLQGRPIAEPVAQYGPFVMNTQQEIAAGHAGLPPHPVRRLALRRQAPVHGADPKRFAKYPGGRESADGLNLLNGPDSPDGRVRGSSAPRRPARSCSG